MLCGIAAVSIGPACGAGEPSSDRPPQTVASVDLQRYAGLWYELAKIPNRFQRKCASGTTAEYVVREDGMIGVVNRCVEADGGVIEASGVARVVDVGTRAKLEVSFVRFFGFQLFWGDYWIIGLGPEYEYAVIGHPYRRYGWVLARSSALSAEQWAEVNTILREQGYDRDDFEMTRHTAESGSGQ
jgi:apolipoprotein D and lipocalin family protein